MESLMMSIVSYPQLGYCRGIANALRKREMVSCNEWLLTNIGTFVLR
jgi:hypothetical protein